MAELKYKVGDRVQIKSIDWYNENKNKYGNINCGYMPFTSDMTIYCGTVLTICDIKDEFSYYQMEKCEYMFMDYMIECKVGEETKSHKNMCKQLIDEMNPNVEFETETHRGYYTTEPETTIEGKKRGVVYFWDNDFADKVELDLSDRELIQEDGKWFVVKKKKEYPKTYEECCKVVNANSCIRLVYNLSDGQKYYHDEDNLYLYENFRRLKICRDAYWMIYGEENGLGKPWEPDWTIDDVKYSIFTIKGMLSKTRARYDGAILSFPTEEMRDAFYENFKKEIEICKELL